MTSPSSQRPSDSARPKVKAPLGKRLGIAGMVIGAFVGLGYAVSQWIAPPFDGVTPDQLSQIEQLSELVEDGTRAVLVGQSDAPEVRATLGTYYEDARRDEVFQHSFAKRFGLEENEYTVFLLTLRYGPTDDKDEDAEEEGNGEPRNDDGAENQANEEEPPPLHVGEESLVFELTAEEGGESRTSVSLRSLRGGDRQAALVAAAYGGEARIPWGTSARRFVVVPGSLSLEEVRRARLTLVDGRTLTLTPRNERYPVPPGLGATDESP